MTCEFCDKLVKAPACDHWRMARNCVNLEAWIIAKAKKIKGQDAAIVRKP